MGARGTWWTLGSPPHTWHQQLNAVINAALDLLECGNPESAKALLRAFSGDSAIDWPKDGQDLAGTRPDVGQNPSEVVE
jgi:hypothetical protein